MKRGGRAAAYALGIAVLIIDARTAAAGALTGVQLCVRVVIPSLFPFFVLSTLLVGSAQGLDRRLLRPLGRLIGMPRGSESLLLTGLLGGYPTGAQHVAQAYRDGQLPEHTAQRLLGICNQAGPAFLFGIISTKFPSVKFAWALWGIQLLSALLSARLLPEHSAANVRLTPGNDISLPTALRRSLRSMCEVCGWIVLLRTLIAFADRWFLWLVPPTARVVIIGLLELTNGCSQLEQISCIGARFVAAAAMLSGGGLCVTAQTATVSAPLRLRSYAAVKGVQTLCSLLLALLAQCLLFPRACQLSQTSLYVLLPLCLGLLGLLQRKSKKTVAIPRQLVYNQKKEEMRAEYAVPKKDGKIL